MFLFTPKSNKATLYFPSPFVDLDKYEEKISQARLTITSSNNEINALQKGGAGYFTLKEINECLSKSFKIKDKILDVINKIN